MKKRDWSWTDGGSEYGLGRIKGMLKALGRNKAKREARRELKGLDHESWAAACLYDLLMIIEEEKDAGRERREIAEKLNLKGIRYVAHIPRKPLPESRVLVHNHIVPQRELGLNGFRAWTQLLDSDLEVCRCKWAGVDLRGLTHYRVRRAWRA